MANEYRGIFDDQPCRGHPDHTILRGSSRYYCGNCGLVSRKKLKNERTVGGTNSMGWAGRKAEKLVARDGPNCHWCGVETHVLRPPLPSTAGITKRNMRTIEHLVSRRNGGGNDNANLVIACHRCNTSRGGDDASLARWATRMAEEAHRCDNQICQRVLSGKPVSLEWLTDETRPKYMAW
jgi:hypothetical protein